MSAPAPASTQQKLYRTLHDQIDLALYPQALRTVNKLLTRDPGDPLALATRAQLVVALDRYPEALQLESPDPLTRAYCLYKLARAHEAAEALNELASDEAAEADPEQERARQILEAQLSYRLGEYEHARDLFDELAATAQLDSPELADLEANLAACTAQLDFLAAVPATLANLSSSGSVSGSRAVPSVDELEARPLAFVLPSTSAASSSATVGGRGQTGKTASPSSRPTATPRARRRPRGKRFATVATDGAENNLPAVVDAATAPPAEDRWIPKRQRPSMRDALLQAKEKQRGRKRDKVMAAATQGSAAVEDDPSRGGQKAGGGGGGGGGGKAASGSGNKKKKGGRK